MLEGLIFWLVDVFPNANITAYEMTPGALSSISRIRPFPSPERYLLGIPGQHGDNSSSALVARIRTIMRGFGFLSRFLVYRLSGTKLMKESRITGFFHQILQADALLFSGGGYLNGVWWADGLYSKVFPALAAKISGVPVILVSQGLGPFHHTLDRLVAWMLFSVSSVIGVRDGKQSARAVGKISARSLPRVIHTGDGSLRVASAPSNEVTSVLRLEGVPDDATQLIAVNFRDSSAYESGYARPPFALAAEVLDELLSPSGRHVVFVPISYHSEDGDRESARNIVTLMQRSDRVTIIDGEHSPSIIKGIVSKAQFAIGTSYHFLLFALSQSVPVVAVYQNSYYRQKLEGLCGMYGQENRCLSLEGINANTLLESCQEVEDNRDSISSQLIARNIELDRVFHDSHKRIEGLISNS